MSNNNMLAPRTIIRVLQPHVSETRGEFRRRMQELIAGLVVQAPDWLTVDIDEQDGRPCCIVSARSERPQSR